MSNSVENEGLRRWRRRAKITWAIMAAFILLLLAAMFVMAATDDTDNIALSRNQVVRTASGERIWKGTF